MASPTAPAGTRAHRNAGAAPTTPAGTRVVTSVQPDGDWVQVSITDDGPGIPDALQRTVFERFSRGDDSRNRAGGSTGLGLSIVEAVTRSHGGRVELASRPGETRFSVRLPTASTPAPTPGSM